MTLKFDLNSTMQEVERTYPFARAMLHAKFHVGGCASCGFEPNETIAQVAHKHSKDASSMVEELNQGIRDMMDAEIDVYAASKLLMHSEKALFVDVREPWEFEICKLGENVTLLNEKTMPLIFDQGRSTQHVVVYCHHGVRSLNAALYMRQNGLPNAVSLKGGIDRYAMLIDPSIQRY